MQKLTSRYGDRASFLRLFNPDRLLAYTQKAERCLFGNAPTLARVNAAYGKGTVEAWLTPLVEKAASFCGARDKAEMQTAELVELIIGEYFYLTVTEVMLFFRRLMTGRYGRFYGAVDPMLILQGLQKFCQERNEAIARRDAEEAVKRQEAWGKNAVTYEEYLSLTIDHYGEEERASDSELQDL